MASPQLPFQYEDITESHIQSIINRFHRTNKSGRDSDPLVPHRRIEQQLQRAKWYKPEQHAQSPYISVSITAPAVLSLGSSGFPIAVTVHHHENLAGNPDSKPITFNGGRSILSPIDTEGKIAPWLLLLHDPSATEGGLKEIDGERETECLAVWDESNIPPPPPPPALLEVNPQNGFITLAVGESKTYEMLWKEAGRLVKKGQRYSLCHRGGLFWRWWKFGTLEEMKGEKQLEQNRNPAERMWVACTNLVDFTVED